MMVVEPPPGHVSPVAVGPCDHCSAYGSLFRGERDKLLCHRCSAGCPACKAEAEPVRSKGSRSPFSDRGPSIAMCRGCCAPIRGTDVYYLREDPEGKSYRCIDCRPWTTDEPMPSKGPTK